MPSVPEPRILTAAEAAIWKCPVTYCQQPAISGRLDWEDRGPFQLISCRTLTCFNGHTWHHETDGS